MIRSIIMLFFVSSFIISHAQTAQDFTITDYTGQVHTLYADHLNQGQTVVIKLFFTSCPPCNAIAADVQLKYVDWGEGQYDVEFLELSTKFFDSNADVAAYSSMHGLTFPGAGENGNSIVASNQFTSGTYGPYYGTPSFAVIASDGTVNWNVGLTALDAAISATGATGGNNPPPLPTVYDINMYSPNGNSNNVPNTTFVLGSTDNPALEIDITPYLDTELKFELPHPSIPDITNPTLKLINNDDVINGVTALDLIIIQKHILGIVYLDNLYLERAADVSSNAIISAIDLITLRKVILGILPQFPNNKSWNFYFSSCNDCKNIVLEDLPGVTIIMDVTSVKTGDVNGQ